MADILVKTFISGASNATQATAQAAYQTALAAVVTGNNPPIGGLAGIQTITAGCDVTADSQAATYLYTFWAYVQYFYAG